MEYKRYEGETEDELIYRICSQKEQIGTWKEVRDILNNLLNYSYNESTYRKKYQYFNKLLYANSSKFSDSEAQLETLREEKRELEKLKKQIQTEKIEYNKWLREEARDKLITEKIVKAINNQEKFDIPSPIIIVSQVSTMSSVNTCKVLLFIYFYCIVKDFYHSYIIWCFYHAI